MKIKKSAGMDQSRVRLIVNKHSKSNSIKAIGKSENVSRINEKKDAKVCTRNALFNPKYNECFF
jgi:hypothetical protein